MQSGEPRRLVRAFQDADGIVRRWEGTLNPVRDADGGIRHVVEVWRDISERTQLEGQLAHSERLASLGMLAAGVAHEINNPLASIVLGVESLSRWVARVRSGSREGLDEPAEVIELLSREANRTREITDKLMLLAQPYQTTAGWVDLNRAAHDTLTLLNHQMRKQGIEAVESLAPDIPAVWARESGLRGVLMNLCINAVQAMPAGGSLTVRSWMLDGTRIAFEIADTGTGINPAHLERIWDPFFTTKPVGSGTGLGLSITRRVVERHGGSIRVTSEPGKGARFVIVLPVHGPGGDRA